MSARPSTGSKTLTYIAWVRERVRRKTFVTSSGARGPVSRARPYDRKCAYELHIQCVAKVYTKGVDSELF